MTTIREQLEIIRDSKWNQWERWRALATVLEQMNLALGVKLDLQFEEQNNDNKTTRN